MKCISDFTLFTNVMPVLHNHCTQSTLSYLFISGKTESVWPYSANRQLSDEACTAYHEVPLTLQGMLQKL